MMNWDRVDSTMAQAFRKNGRDLVDASKARTPLSDLMAKDPQPDFGAMTELQLCEFAADHHVAIAEDLSRAEIVTAIQLAMEVNWEERLRGFKACLRYVFADGPHPLALNRRAYALAKAIDPEVIWNMSLAEIAVLSGDGNGPRRTDGRATVSERVKRLYEAPIKKAGMRGCKASYQKDASASAAYAEAGKGNQNRRGRDFLEVVAANGATKK